MQIRHSIAMLLLLTSAALAQVVNPGGGGGGGGAGSGGVPTIVGNLQSTDINTFARTAIGQMHFNFTCDNSDGWYAGNSYYSNGMYTADISFTMLAYPGYFTPAQVRNVVNKTIGAKNVGGDFPLAVARDCTSGSSQFYTGFDSAHKHVTADGARAVSMLTYLYYRETGDLSLYTTNIAAIKTAWANVPRNGTSHLITVVAGDEYVPCTGFMETMRSIGDNACANVMYYYSAKALATMATAAGDSTNATFFNSEASTVQAATISSLTDATTQLLKADTNQLNSNLDVVTSAVACFPFGGIAPMLGTTQCQSIWNYFNTNQSTLIYLGLTRESPTSWATMGTIPVGGGAPYGALPAGYGPTQYQDGFFGFHSGWVMYGINSVSPSSTAGLLSAYRTSANPYVESYAQDHSVSGGSTVLMATPAGPKVIADLAPTSVTDSMGSYVFNTAALELPAGTTIGGSPVCTIATCGTSVAPVYVDGDTHNNGAGSTTQATSKTFNVSAGDLIVVSCVGGNASTALTVTSSASDTVTGSTALQTLPSSAGENQGFYILNAVGGPTTFSCNSAAQVFLGLGVVQYHKGTLTALDTSVANTTASNATYTTSSFTTSALATKPSLIVVCGHAGFAATLSAGVIGGVAANSRITGAPVCEDRIATGPLTSITGTTTASISGNWGGFAMAFK